MNKDASDLFGFTVVDIGDPSIIDQWYSETKQSYSWTIELCSGHSIWGCYYYNLQQFDFFVEEPGSDKLIDIGELTYDKPLSEDQIIDVMYYWVLENLGVDAA